MGIAARLDHWGKPAWIGLLVLTLILFWPLGLALLAYLIGSGRMRCWKHGGDREWREHAREWRQQWRDWKRAQRGGYRPYPPSGNSAFDEYRDEVLRRLEEEQKEFRDFLDRLRHAKDKAEFDQFMTERRRRDQGPPPAAPTQPEPQA